MKRFNKFLVGALAVTLFATNAASAVSVRIIKDNGGGSVEIFLMQVLATKRTGTKIVFAGRCDSACGIFLSLPKEQLCLTKDASFGFHRVYLPFFRRSVWSQKLASAYTRKVVSLYPPWVQSWIQKNGGLSDEIKPMPYSYARKYLATCKKPF